MEYYIYELIVPRVNTPFYIGKGSKRRAQSHFGSHRKEKNLRDYLKESFVRNTTYQQDTYVLVSMAKENITKNGHLNT